MYRTIKALLLSLILATLASTAHGRDIVNYTWWVAGDGTPVSTSSWSGSGGVTNSAFCVGDVTLSGGLQLTNEPTSFNLVNTTSNAWFQVRVCCASGGKAEKIRFIIFDGTGGSISWVSTISGPELATNVFTVPTSGNNFAVGIGWLPVMPETNTIAWNTVSGWRLEGVQVTGDWRFELALQSIVVAKRFWQQGDTALGGAASTGGRSLNADPWLIFTNGDWQKTSAYGKWSDGTDWFSADDTTLLRQRRELVP